MLFIRFHCDLCYWNKFFKGCKLRVIKTVCGMWRTTKIGSFPYFNNLCISQGSWLNYNLSEQKLLVRPWGIVAGIELRMSRWSRAVRVERESCTVDAELLLINVRTNDKLIITYKRRGKLCRVLFSLNKN